MKLKYTLEGKSSLLFALAMLLPVSYAQAHSGLTSGIAWEVCEDKPRSEACEYSNAHGDLYIGTCQSISSHMLCVRNKPIVKSKPKHEHKTPEIKVESEEIEAKSELKETPKAPKS